MNSANIILIYFIWINFMSLVSEIILNSDDELRYPTIGELEICT